MMSTQKLKRFVNVFLDELTADVFFVVATDNCSVLENLPAHKIILASCSPVFMTMFFGSLAEKGDVRIFDATAETFKVFLRYFYADDVAQYISMENVAEIVYLAQKYEIGECLDICEHFLIQNLNTDQICKGIELAEKFDLKRLKEWCKRKIYLEPKNLLNSTSFTQCSVEVFQAILRWNAFDLRLGYDLFMFCHQWAENAWKQQHGMDKIPTPADVRDQLNECFDLIDFCSMNARQIVSILNKFTTFFTQSDLIKIHSILGAKYPNPLATTKGMQCKLKQALNPNENIDRSDSVEQIAFQSSKEVYYGGFYLAGTNTNISYYAVIKKLPSMDVVVFQSGPMLQNESYHVMEHEFVVIEPNTTYEIRLKIENYVFEKKLCFTSTVFDLGNNDKISTHGDSIISSLIFMC